MGAKGSLGEIEGGVGQNAEETERGKSVAGEANFIFVTFQPARHPQATLRSPLGYPQTSAKAAPSHSQTSLRLNGPET